MRNATGKYYIEPGAVYLIGPEGQEIGCFPNGLGWDEETRNKLAAHLNGEIILESKYKYIQKEIKRLTEYEKYAAKLRSQKSKNQDLEGKVGA